MENSANTFTFSTSNYDAMKKFLSDFGFGITEDPRDPFARMFNGGRGARVRRGNLDFNLEESASGGQKADFNLFLTDVSDEEVQRIKSLGYKCDQQVGLYGESHSFKTPDGGTFEL